jgi:hypothetical protein
MALSPSPGNNAFRRSAIIATSAIAILFSGNALAQTASAGGPANCNRLGPTTAGVKCAIKELDHRIGAANATAAAAREQDACGQFLLKGVADKKWTQAEILAQAGGKFTPGNVCEVAKRRGFDRRASLGSGPTGAD